MMLPLYNNKEFKIPKSYRIKEKLQGWLRLILSDKNSRNLFMFLLLNLSFAFVELIYGFITNSLGLISDSFHMFFDCTALIAGLAASLITKWKPNERFSYGYVRAEVLAGFVNGLFLLFIAFFIFTEAVERVMEPPEVKHDRLFIISVLGLIVNLVGIFVFQHGGSGDCSHGHSHGAHSHDNHSHHGHHDHSHHSHDHSHNHSHSNYPNDLTHHHNHTSNHHYPNSNPLLINSNSTQAPALHLNHNHNHHHNSSETSSSSHSQIMHGVFLHILADTLGSVGVIISAILMSQFGWMIADPICSIFISALVALSVIPLLRNSGAILLQRTPTEIEKQLPACYQRIMQIDGVYSVQDPHFWTLCTDNYVGTIKVEVKPNADPKLIQFHVHSIFNQINVNVIVQIDFHH